MSQAIVFLRDDFQLYSVHQNVEDSIDYWLGKSPGIYMDEYEHIFVVDTEQDYIGQIHKLRERQYKYEQQLREQSEKSEYERLKRKFEP